MTSGQELIRRLREDVQMALAQRASAIGTDLASLQQITASKLEEIRQKLDEPPAPELPIEGTIAGVLETAEKLQGELAAEAGDRTAQLAECAEQMRSQETQEEILNCLADGAARFASRLAVLLVRPEGCSGWTARGLSDPAGAQIRELFVEAGRSPLLAGAVKSGTASTEVPEDSPLAEFLANNGEAATWHAVRLRAMGKSVAVVAAAGSSAKACDPGALRVLVELAGLNLENMALRVLQEVRAAKPATPPRAPETRRTIESSAPPEPSVTSEGAAAPAVESAAGEAAAAEVPLQPEVVPVPQRESAAESVEAAEAAEPEKPAVAPAIEEQEPGSTPDAAAAKTVIAELDRTLETIRETLRESEPVAVAAEPEPAPVPEHASAPAGEAAQEPAEAFHRLEFAPPVLEPAVVPEPPPVAEPTPEPAAAPEAPPLSPVALPPRPAAPQPVHAFAEEERLHTDAKRFARLLVSEIKLYNERRVLEGRENRDIYVRLKRDIDRSREVYEKRVSPTVARKVDYFHDEIIRILGDNDPTTLGSDYPGPRAEN